MIDSHEEGCEKPDPRLFEIALERAGARAGAVAHLGDLFHIDVVGARAAGIDGWLYDPHDMHADKDCRRFSTLDQVLAAVLD
jgi:putative hydrolase of the HAD superfamily